MAAIAQTGFREPNLLMKIASRPTAMAGLLIIIAMIVLALLAPVISPYDPAQSEDYRRREQRHERHDETVRLEGPHEQQTQVRHQV